MNIAILIYGLEGGGAERVASLIGNYYVEQGHRVYYFLSKNSRKSVYVVKGKIIHTDIIVGQGTIRSLFKAASIMKKYKRAYEIDVSISFMEEFNYINVMSKDKDIVITRICTILSAREELKKTSFLYNKNTVRFFYNRADKVVVMTNYAKKEMEHQYGVKRKKLLIIPNPVFLQSMRKNTINAEWIYGVNTVICVGRLEEVKQHTIAIRSFSTVVKECPNAKLLILGKGPNKRRLNTLIKDLQLENHVFLLGFQKDVVYYLQNAKVFLMTSVTEGFPNSMVEAMAAGVPVVSIDSPGAPREILKTGGIDTHSIQYGKYGIITPYVKNNYMAEQAITREEQIIGQAIKKLLSDEGLREEYARAAFRRAQMYKIEKIMDIWNKIIMNEKN